MAQLFFPANIYSLRAFPNPFMRRKPRSYVEQSACRASEKAQWGRPQAPQ